MGSEAESRERERKRERKRELDDQGRVTDTKFDAMKVIDE